MAKLLITNDLFDIADRLKSVNEFYKLVFNTETQRYEVYDSSRGDSLAFVVPYDELDARTVAYAEFTAVQNAKAVFAEVEKHNAELERNNLYRLRQKISEQAEKVVSKTSLQTVGKYQSEVV